MNLKDFWVIWLSKLYKKYERFNKKILRKRQKMVHFALGATEQKFPQKISFHHALTFPHLLL